MIVLWARHGQNLANVTRTFSYRVYDEDLTDLGRAQARELGERLRGEPDRPTAIVCSPMKRARQTADVIADVLDLPVAEEIEDLRERNVGELDGRHDDDSWGIHDAVLDAWDRDERDIRFPGGESLAELVTRVRRALEHIARSYQPGPVLACAHGGNIRSAIADLSGQPPGGELRNAETVRLDVRSVGEAGVDVRLIEWSSPG